MVINAAKKFLVAISVLLSTPILHAAGVTGEIVKIGDTTHLEFKGKKDWLYESPVKVKDKITVILPAFSDETASTLENWSCPFIKKITVDKNAPDGRYQLTFQLTSEKVESFDYLTDDPSSLIFDFYKQVKLQPDQDTVAKNELEGKEESPKRQSSDKSENDVKSKNQEHAKGGVSDYKKVDRKPAGSELLQVSKELPEKITAEKVLEEENVDLSLEKGVFDGADPDYERFRMKGYNLNEDSIIASRQNIYLKFPFLLQKTNRMEEIMKTSPKYEIKEKNDEENKEARLVLHFFERQKWGSFFETLNVFNKKYPNTKYDEILKNMTAEAYIRLYYRDKNPNDYQEFRSIYKYLVETFPDSILTQRNKLLLAYSSLEQGDGVESLRLIQELLRSSEKNSDRDYLRLAKAEALQILSQSEDAIKTYGELNVDADNRTLGIEALYRIGDIHAQNGKLEDAIKAYANAQKQYKDFKGTYANAAFNTAEAKFWLKQYKDSLDDYIEFLKAFPSHRYGGFALTRIGELLEIMGAPQKQVVGAYLEGYFRYPDSPGSEVSRMRMLVQGLKGMPDREKKRAIEEIDHISQASSLPRMLEFGTLLKSEGIAKRKEYKDSLDFLLTYYQNNPTTADKALFKTRILRNISDILKEQVEKNEYIEALDMFGKFSTTWLKNANRIDTDFYRSVAYEKSGVNTEALSGYEKIYKKLKSISGTNEEKERRVLENLPSVDQLRLRISGIALNEKRYRDAFKNLKEIKGSLSEEEEVEKVMISSEVATQMGDYKNAISNLEKNVKMFEGKPNLVTPSELKLVQLFTKIKKYDEAEKLIEKLEQNKKSENGLSDDSWAQTLELKGNLKFLRGDKLAAVETYTQLLDSYEATRPLSAIRYKAGMILFEQGDLKGAEKYWTNFDNKMGVFYKKLAQEKLSQAVWQDSYKKYIDRIPAAENLK